MRPVNLRACLSLAVAALAAAAAPAMAQTHVDNPFVGTRWYVNPDYTANADATAAQTADTALAANMRAVGRLPTAVWLDRIAAVPSLATHLDAALAQGANLALFVVYDLPGRDCAALASNGELPLTAAGLAQYRSQYIDPIVATVRQAKYAGVRIVLVVEPDSLPNLVTNQGTPACAQASSSGIYVQGVQYAINQLHAVPNVYLYVDLAHSGWLGWSNNADGMVSLLDTVASGLTDRKNAIDGFVSDTANTLPILEPYMTATQAVGGQQVMSATFYQSNPDIDETHYTADMYARLTAAGWPSTIGMVIDTSRNGWGGPQRPAGPSSSTDLNTFVTATKIDRRAHRGLWCNPAGAGIGERPQASPPGFPASHLDAFIWVKPPGESDGASSDIPNDQGKRFDRMCDPTYQTQYGMLTGALPDAPLSGQWFAAQFTQLVQNAYPPVGTPAPVCSAAPPAPAAVTATAVSSGEIDVAWSAVAPPANCSVTYSVYRSTTAGFTPSAATLVASGLTSLSSASTGLAAGTTYHFVVRAVDAAGASADARASATTTGTGTCTAAPPAVSVLTAQLVSSSQVSLSWNTVSAPPNCAVTYNVFRSTTNGFTPSSANQVASGLARTTFDDTGLAASTTYFYAVQAVDAAGAAAVARVSATTPGGTGGCHVTYSVLNSWPGGFQVSLKIQNTGTAAWTSWTLTWDFPAGQRITQLWNGDWTQSGATVTVKDYPSSNANIPAGGSYDGVGFTATFSGTNDPPTRFVVNGVACD